MAIKTLQSNQVAFIDTTDARKLEVYITSNLATAQIYNTNTKTYSPDWSVNNLKLSAGIYLDSQNVTSNTNTKIEWYEQIGAGAETLVGNSTSYTINTNKMSGDITVITYICKSTYNDNGNNSPTAQTKITFTRTDTGLNGADGSNAPAVVAQYSVDGTSTWTTTLDAAIHKYIRFSYDGSLTWTTAIKIAGEDGTSVTIAGTAYYDGTLSDDNIGQDVILYSDEDFNTQISNLSTGDAYIVQGYLCVYNESTDSFICSGTIKGPKGNDGVSSYLHIRYADDENGTNMSTLSTNKICIGACVTNSINGPTTSSSYTWRRFVGNDAYTLVLTNETHTFAGDVSNAFAGSTTTQVLAYKGGVAQNVTIATVNGIAASTSNTNTGIAGLTFKCSALSGATPTITFTCTTSFVSASGTIPIVISVDGVSFTKMFTYSIAFKGTAGASSSSYWLVSNTSTVQKTSSGDIVCTPSTVTFSGKNKTGAGTPTDYACRWIIAYTTDGTTYTDLYISTANEASISVDASITYKAIRARMYLAGGMTTLLDEQIVPFVSDGAVGTSGTDAVTFQIYSSNGYVLSTDIPIITLQTFAYAGDAEIKAGATYQWYKYNGTDWVAIDGATNAYFDVSRDDVDFDSSYMCKMQFNGAEYVGVATIDDKGDDSRVFTTKPSSYKAGDLWIVGADYAPPGREVQTWLKAEHTSSVYSDDDWTLATKYDKDLTDLKNDFDTYKQYFSYDENGVKISARDQQGIESEFTMRLTNTQLSFNYGDEAIAYVNGTKINIKEAEIESPLTVTGKYSGSTMQQAPIINIGNFSIVVESNGSLSIVANT